MYKSRVRCALSYGAECWASKKEEERKLQTTEMKMPHVICEKTQRDGIRNETIREMTEVEKMRCSWDSIGFRWLGT